MKMSKDWMTPEEQFRLIVEPTVEDYRHERTDHRKENAIFQLSSFSERFFKYHSDKGNAEAIYGASTFAKFRGAVSKHCPEYELLWDAANAVKHQIPDEKIRTGSYVLGASEAWSPDQKYDVGGRLVTLDQAIETEYGFWRTTLFGDEK